MARGWPMRSLQRRLLTAFCLALGTIGAASALLAYLVFNAETSSMLDDQMQQIARLAASQVSRTSNEQPTVIPQPRIEYDRDDEMLVFVRDAQGRMLFASQTRVRPPAIARLGFQDVDLDGRSYRVLAVTANDRSIVVAQENEARWEMASAASFTALLPLIVLIPVLGLITALVIRVQFRPMHTAIAEITARPPFALSPISTANLPTEMRPLVDAMNRLLIRLADAVRHEQRFLTDAAHALRTPLTALQLQADVLEQARTTQDRNERSLELRAGIRRASRLATQLLALARDELEPALESADEGYADADLGSALAEITALYAPVATARSINLQVSSPDRLHVRAPASRLMIIIGNLLDNALRYTPAGGTVRISASRTDNIASIEVTDEGPGLPEHELGKVFERFYRAVGDTTEGSGLGLTVVQTLSKQIGGHVSLDNRRDGSGLVARLCVPAANMPPKLPVAERDTP